MDLAQKVIVCDDGLQVDGRPDLRIKDMRSLHALGPGKKWKLGKTESASEYPRKPFQVKSNHHPRKMTFSTGPTHKRHGSRRTEKSYHFRERDLTGNMPSNWLVAYPSGNSDAPFTSRSAHPVRSLTLVTSPPR
jgi:hypothetical protein